MQVTLPSSASSFDRAAERARVQQERRRSAIVDLVVTLSTIALALLVGFLVMLIVGKDPILAYSSLLSGPLSRSHRAGRWIEDATTLIILGLSVAIPFRARQFSLGAQGQMFIAAMIAAVIAIYLPLPPVLAILLPLVAAMLAGFVTGLLPGLIKAYLNANEIVSTLMLNAVIVLLYDFLLTNVFTPPGAQSLRSELIQPNSMLLRLSAIFGINLGRANLAVVMVAVLVLAVWVLLSRTPLGYEIRIIGANEKFARYGGINTQRTIALSFAIGGAIAAVAGVHLVLGVHQRLIPAIAAGLGFEGIVVALLARNNPLLIPITGLFYSYLRVGGDIMEQEAAVGAEIVQVIQAVIILLLTAQVLVNYAKSRHRLMRST
ncbi:MAG: ABC transporter permease [Chloroflexi bacterium]|jgi:simple sugar transport system permease protein|uniref:ABC transporter permease n=1 Tax=Candidatus Thermofonsia Clade 3 bacterium TaxID=2364212 RepID=A0A2M8QDL4_9CHLR|nr:ABC transporter permease [Candidatus Roseilinea sp. NK_OTU-006]PJF47894.1 MAG: ABC transporter permease [Candidatus Thermofonsia Clade 3 bacterium]RMG65543.1 MAG: ABC transporter permease [Chloroflexota bacterium]